MIYYFLSHIISITLFGIEIINIHLDYSLDSELDDSELDNSACFF